MSSKCEHVCSKSNKPCDSTSKKELEGKGYCPKHYSQHKLKQGIEEVPDIFSVAKEKDPNEP